MKFTQIITGNSLTIMHEKFHEACILWQINHVCHFLSEDKKVNVDVNKENIAKYIMLEATKQISYVTQLPESIQILDVDLDQLGNLKVENDQNIIYEKKIEQVAAASRIMHIKDAEPDIELPVNMKIGEQNFVLDSCRIYSKVGIRNNKLNIFSKFTI